jgi:hypothetical protein
VAAWQGLANEDRRLPMTPNTRVLIGVGPPPMRGPGFPLLQVLGRRLPSGVGLEQSRQLLFGERRLDGQVGLPPQYAQDGLQDVFARAMTTLEIGARAVRGLSNAHSPPTVVLRVATPWSGSPKRPKLQMLALGPLKAVARGLIVV